MQFWDKCIYFNIKSGKLRTSCRDLTICNKWDAYKYYRHFKRKCHHDYMNRLCHDHVEKERLKEARDNFLRMHLVAEEQTKLKSLLLYKGGGEPLTVDDTQTIAYYQVNSTYTFHVREYNYRGLTHAHIVNERTTGDDNGG